MFEIKFGTIEFIPYLCNTEKKNKKNYENSQGRNSDSLYWLQVSVD